MTADQRQSLKEFWQSLNGWQKRTFAVKAGLRYDTVSAIAAGKSRPSKESAEAIVRASNHRVLPSSLRPDLFTHTARIQ